MFVVMQSAAVRPRGLFPLCLRGGFWCRSHSVYLIVIGYFVSVSTPSILRSKFKLIKKMFTFISSKSILIDYNRFIFI